MKRFLTSLAIGAGLAVTLMMGASTQANAQDYPKVSNLKPFTAEANYMSLPGYLRFLVYERDGVWLDRMEAASIVDNQIATGE